MSSASSASSHWRTTGHSRIGWHYLAAMDGHWALWAHAIFWPWRLQLCHLRGERRFSARCERRAGGRGEKKRLF